MQPAPFTPTCSPTPLSEADSFETISLAIAAAFIAADQLSYSHCKLQKPNSNYAVFIFRDPLHVGLELQRRYTAGLFPSVNPKILADARGYLTEQCNRMKGCSHANRKG
jgi:hypothetical protein